MNQIKLKDFIKNTLVEIAQGVQEANTVLTGGKAAVFTLRFNRGSQSEIRGVEFDVAVTANKEDKDTAGFVVALVHLGGGAKTERSFGGELAHRIKFEIGLETNWS